MKSILFLLTFVTSMQISCTSCVAFKEIFTNSKVLGYLHPEIKERTTLYLVENEYCSLNEKLGNITVTTVPEAEAMKHQNYIKVVEVKDSGNETIIKLYYPIEGAYFTITFENDKIKSVDIADK